MTFKKLSFYFQELEKTSSRLAMMEILSRLFTEAKVEEIDKICYLSLGKLGPKYESEKFQLADKLIIRTLAQAFGVDESIVKEFEGIYE